MLVNLNPGHFPSLTDHPYHYSREVMDVELMTTKTKMKASIDDMKLIFLNMDRVWLKNLLKTSSKKYYSYLYSSPQHSKSKS